MSTEGETTDAELNKVRKAFITWHPEDETLSSRRSRIKAEMLESA